MLEEFKNIVQEKDSFRRMFTDKDIDLDVWYNADKHTIRGFRIVYDKNQEDTTKAVTWESGKGICHSKIYIGGVYKPTVIPAESAGFDSIKMLKLFMETGKNIDKYIYVLVCSVLQQSK
jgi:hypothetical protein